MTTQHGFRALRAVRWTAILAGAALAAGTGCGGRILTPAADGGMDAGTDAEPPTTIDEIPVDSTMSFPGLTGNVDVVRDVYGIPHFYAGSEHDLFFAQGLFQSFDRFMEMHLVRLTTQGRVAELAGAFQESLAVMDVTWRGFRFRALAAEQWAAMDKTSTVAVAVQAFSDGVNAYIAGLRSGDYQLPVALTIFKGAIPSIEDWTPEDTLALAKFYVHSLSYHVDGELIGTELLQESMALFDNADPMLEPDLAARAGAFADIWRFAPASPGSNILDGVPNMPVDTGTVARTALLPHGAGLRPLVPGWLLRSARHGTAAAREAGGLGNVAIDGSNNWVVDGTLTADGVAIVSNDPHLQLYNPPVLYLNHINLDRSGADPLNAAGAIFPGAPGVVIGFNRHVAWGATVAYEDANDIYLESIVPCATGTGDCALFEGGEVPLESTQEQIIIGLFGAGIDSWDVTVETVPHHGPVVPYVDDGSGEVLNRTASPDPSMALSVRWTGLEASAEIEAFFGLIASDNVSDIENALDSFESGAINFVSADDAGDIFFSASSNLPLRDPAAMTFHAETNRAGNGPMFVLPGDGSAEWSGGFISESFVPHALNPAAGFVASSNNDPVGLTDDNDPLNDPIYTGWDYDLGFRNGRIKALLSGAGAALTLDDMERFQSDVHSNIGELLVPHVLAAVTALDEELATPGAHPDLATFAGALSMAEVDALRDAGAILAAWSLEALSGFEKSGDPDLIASDSAATAIFNVWLIHAVRGTFKDELDLLGWEPLDEERPLRQRLGRAIVYLYETDPGDLVAGTHPTTGDSILFDNLETTGEAESRNRITLEALAAALAHLASPPAASSDDPPGGFGSANPMDWKWGTLHTLTIGFPLSTGGGGSALDIPAFDDPDFPDGYPRHGENYTVDVANHGLWDLDFSYDFGAAIRFVCRLDPDGPEARIVIPGGMVFDTSSPHFDDDAALYFENRSHEFPYTEEEVVAAAESRIVLTP